MDKRVRPVAEEKPLRQVAADVLWQLMDDPSLPGQIQSQICEIARVLDGERMRWFMFVVKH